MKPGAVYSEGVEDKLCAIDPVSGRSTNFWGCPKWIIGKRLAELLMGHLPLPHGDDDASYIIYEAYEMAGPR